MKKYFILTIAIAVMGLVFVSCAKEKLIENSGTQANEIALKSATISTKSAIDGTTFPDGYGMLVSAYRNKETGTTAAEADASGDYFEGITFTKKTGGSTWVAGTPKYWPLNGKLDFLCIASAGLKTAANGVVPTCVWGDSNNAAKKVVATVPDNAVKFDDILYGSANGQIYNTTGNGINFNHAECAVVFFAKSNIAYDETKNTGITITDITLNNPYTSGVLTVNNPEAGASTGSLSASWDLSSETTTTTLKARVWAPDGAGVKTDEPALTKLDLTTTYSDSGANAATPTTLNTNKFGDAYVILPPQNAVSFDISYTLHNGFKADGTTPLDISLKYTRIPTADDLSTDDVDETEVWGMGKKVVYLINITLNQIEISPIIIDWVNDFRTIEI